MESPQEPVVGGYRLVRKLGQGGMGEVWVGEHHMLDRAAAIKLLLPTWSSDAATLERFFTEARATSRIRHPGIVEIVDCGVTPGGRAFIVMELLEGKNLREHVAAAGGADLALTYRVAVEIAGALAAAHAQKIVHRDLKPDNIFVVAGGDAQPAALKVLDFGIAKLVDRQSDAHLTGTGVLIGTPAYMSPEQCRGRATVDQRTDIYSLGCILFELVAGRPPFVYEGAGELIAAHLTEEPPALGALAAHVPPWFEGLVMAMLAKDPARRPASMTDVQALVLGELAQEGTTLAAPLSPVPRGTSVLTPARGETRALPGSAPAVVKTTFSHTAGELTTAVAPPRRRWALVLGGGGAVAALLIAVVMGGGGGAKAPPPPPPAAAPPPRPEPPPLPVTPEPAGTPAVAPVAPEPPAPLPQDQDADKRPSRRKRSAGSSAATDRRDLDALEDFSGAAANARRRSRTSDSASAPKAPGKKTSDLDALAE